MRAPLPVRCDPNEVAGRGQGVHELWPRAHLLLVRRDLRRRAVRPQSPQGLDESPYHSEGKTLREELADIPKGARAADKVRVRAFLGLADGQGHAKGMSVDELADLIRDNGWRSRKPLLEAAAADRTERPALYEAVLRFGAKRLDEVINMVWELEGDDLEPSGCRVAKLRDAALRMPCVCGGQWRPAAERLLQIQGLDSAAFRSVVVRALRWGRRKSTNVLIVGEPDGGKSFLLKPLGRIFKSFIRRGQSENFALQGVHGHEICLLQDVRYESFGLPWDDWLAWGEGEEVTVKMPRSHFAESKKYTGTAPLFATMADLFSYPITEARKHGRNVEKENRQFNSRWAIVRFRNEIPVEERNVALEACGRCAAEWYAEVSSRVLAEGPPAEVTDDTLRTSAAIAAAMDPTNAFEQLRDLIAWRQQGLLADDEFHNAKKKFGL